jgi:hypothetical protein
MQRRLGLDEAQILLIRFWTPALVNGAIAWLLLLLLGQTPLMRASGLALVIIGVTLALRRMGSILALIGGLALTLSPVFWSQTGGGQGEPATIVIALAAASVTVIIVAFLSNRPYIGMGLGIVVFAGLFWSQIGTPRSIRLTAFIISWLMFLLIDMLLLTNPRPDEAPMILRDGRLKTADGAAEARPYHTLGILLLMAVGVLNDPLLTLLFPSIALSLFLTHTRFAWWYWLALGLIAIVGLRGLWVDYMIGQAHLLALVDWRDGARWVNMIQLVISQFSIIGIIFGVLGLARLARWYPPLGTVLMLAYAAYWFFGLVYSGNQRDLLLLPMLVIQIVWMCYAVLALSEWVAKSLQNYPKIGRYIVILGYGILPLLMFFNILQN